MADIAALLANSAQTNADWNALPNINKSYWEGLDQNFKNKVRNVFSGGIPTVDGTPNGPPDYGEMSRQLAQTGDIDSAIKLSNLDLLRQKLQRSQNIQEQVYPSGSGPQAQGDQTNIQQSPPLSPSLSRTNSTQIAPAINQGTGGGGNQAQPTVRSILSVQGINDPTGETATSLARQLGVNPNDPLDINDPRISNVLRPAIAQYKRMGVGQVYTQGQATPQPQVVPPVTQGGQPQPQPPPGIVVGQGQPPQGNQPQPQQPQPQPPSQSVQGEDQTVGGLVPRGRTKAQQIWVLSRSLSDPNLEPDLRKSYEKDKADIIATMPGMQVTEEQRKAAARGMNLEQYQKAQSEEASQQAGATERAKSDVKEQDTIRDAGRTAQNRLTTLNAMSNIIDSDKNMTLGAGGDIALKVKMYLKQLGVPEKVIGDLSGAQAYQKLGTTLAGEQTKALGGSRPTQFEFKTFLGVNPGLLLDREGNLRMLGIFSQLAKREVDLGRLARQNRDNWDNWDQVVQQYDKQNPMRDPKTGQPITTDTIIAPGPTKASPSSAAPQQFPNARQGKDAQGNPGWFVPDPNRPGKYMQVQQ